MRTPTSRVADVMTSARTWTQGSHMELEGLQDRLPVGTVAAAATAGLLNPDAACPAPADESSLPLLPQSILLVGGRCPGYPTSGLTVRSLSETGHPMRCLMEAVLLNWQLRAVPDDSPGATQPPERRTRTGQAAPCAATTAAPAISTSNCPRGSTGRRSQPEARATTALGAEWACQDKPTAGSGTRRPLTASPDHSGH